MAKITKSQAWDILEDRLLAISETRLGRHSGEAKLAVSVIVSAGRDDDLEWMGSNLFRFYCQMAGLYTEPTLELVVRTIQHFQDGGIANFENGILEA